MSKAILLVISLAISFLPANSAQIDQTPAQVQVLEGEIENVDGSPVRIIEASVTAVDDPTKAKPAKAIKILVKLKNISGSRIRRLHLAYSLETSAGTIITSRIAVDDLLNSETRVAEGGNLTIGGYQDMSDVTYLIRPTGAEFAQNVRTDAGLYFSGSADAGAPLPTPKVKNTCESGPGYRGGPFWAAPRTDSHPLFRDTLSKQNPYMTISHWNWTDGIYEANLRFHSTGVKAYRLGVVKDTPKGFEVKLGRWATLGSFTSERNTYIPIKASDPDASLTPDEMFPKEPYTRYRRGKAITTPGGVAVFIAEVKLSNGKTWKQCKERAALLWDN